MNSDFEFLCEDLTVEFPIFDSHSRSVKTRLIDGGSVSRSFKGLDGINVTIQKHERIGLLGRNGAGKSTFLRTLAGIYPPTEGRMKINTKTTSFFEVGVGIDPDASGYDNIPLLMASRSIPLTRLEEVIEDVEEFTELGEALSRPLRTYSSGMRLRLAFAAATFEVQGALLMDEVIGVGDTLFRKKARERLEAVIGNVPTLVLASHSMEFLKAFCTEALVFDGGKIVYQGSIENAAQFYEQSTNG